MAKILIVDDSQIVRTELKAVLTKAGHEVLEGADGREGLEQIMSAAKEIKLVISDMHMPGMSGLEMLQNAKAHLGEWPFKVFILTTDTSEVLKTEGKKVGITAWILKPFDSARLLAAIDKVLSLAKK